MGSTHDSAGQNQPSSQPEAALEDHHQERGRLKVPPDLKRVKIEAQNPATHTDTDSANRKAETAKRHGVAQPRPTSRHRQGFPQRSVACPDRVVRLQS
jgi:hypothetical protein